MPWQRQVLDVGLEIDPETECFAYREVIVTVMRQQGKTAGIILPIEVDRCTMWPDRQRVVYTAQTGSDARKKLLEDQVPAIKASVLWKLVDRVHQAQGNEGILFKNGSRIGVAASSQEAGHGFVLDVGVLDEFWKDEDDRREQAMIPAMNTRPWAQLWLTSTMGTDKSVYLNRKVETGRHAATVDKGTGVAYFEWSIPGDADIHDPETWWEYMPALGWTIQPAVVAHALETMSEPEWRRAFGNQPTKSQAERLIPDIIWEAVQQPRVTVNREQPNLWFGVDVHPDRGTAAIVAADERTIEVLDHKPGTGWVIELAKRAHETWNGKFVIDGGGPAGSLGVDLENAGLPVVRINGPDLAAACARMYDAIADAKVTFRRDESMDEALEGLARRPVGDRFVWSRSTSTSDITPFYAATLAYDQAAQFEPEPEVRFIAFD